MKLNAKSILTLSLVTCATVAATSLLIWNESTRRANAMVFPALTPTQLKVALYRVGLDPKSLTAAGVSSNSVAGLVNSTQNDLQTVQPQLDAADSNVADLRQQVLSLEYTIQSGHGTQSDVTALANARTNLANVLATQQGLLDELFNTATFNLSSPQKLILTRLRANRDWDASIEFQTVNRTEAQWVQLRDALANERISASHNEPANPDAQTLLVQLRSDPTVSAAISNLSVNLPSVNSAWEQATVQQQ